MGLCAGLVVVELAAESRLGLTDGARKGNAGLAARDALEREALLLKPRLHFPYVRVGHAKAVGELVGRKPLVVEGGGSVLLRGDQGLESLFLCGGSAEDNAHAAKHGCRAHAADVVARPGHRGMRAADDGAFGAVDFPSNPRGGRLCYRRGGNERHGSDPNGWSKKLPSRDCGQSPDGHPYSVLLIFISQNCFDNRAAGN